MQQNDKDIKQKAEECLWEEMRKISLMNGVSFSVKREIEKSVIQTAFTWIRTGRINSIHDAIKAANIFHSKSNTYKTQAETEKKHGDSSGWTEEYTEREQIYKWMADGLMDAVRKADSV